MSRLDRLRNQIQRLVSGTETESLYQQRKHLVEENDRLTSALEIAEDSLIRIGSGCLDEFLIAREAMSKIRGAK